MYQLKITLQDIKPPIWRRLCVPGTTTLAVLHDVIQTAFGWTDSHLHEFSIGESRYGRPDHLEELVADERSVTVAAAVRSKIKLFGYVYDFGDEWLHEIQVEKVLPSDAGAAQISCLDGRRQGPPEDCGGPWGYAEFLEAIGDPNHPEHHEKLDWIGGAFDPEAFDVASANRALAALAPRKKRARGAAG
jgi:hypothetical protein